MTPRPLIRPEPPPETLRAMTPGEQVPATETSLASRYLTGLARIGGWKVLGLHYALVAALCVGFWSVATSGSPPHPEILLKLLGAYCFLIGTIVIPLVSQILFPSPGETDPAFNAAPVGPVLVFDSRMLVTLIVSAFATLPLLPVFLSFDPIQGNPMDPYDIIPFIQAVATAAWVHLLMEIASIRGDRPGRFARRLAIVIVFVMLHIGLVGLLAQLAFSYLQEANALKIIIDINPFSQLYMLMEGRSEQRLMFNTYSQTLIDYRLYLLFIQAVILGIAWPVYRAYLHTKTRQ